jgi:hypothetical protein
MLEFIQDFKIKNLFMTGCSYVEYLEEEKKHRELKWWEKLYIWYYENFEYIILVVGGILILLILYYHFWGDEKVINDTREEMIQYGGDDYPIKREDESMREFRIRERAFNAKQKSASNEAQRQLEREKLELERQKLKNKELEDEKQRTERKAVEDARKAEAEARKIAAEERHKAELAIKQQQLKIEQDREERTLADRKAAEKAAKDAAEKAAAEAADAAAKAKLKADEDARRKAAEAELNKRMKEDPNFRKKMIAADLKKQKEAEDKAREAKGISKGDEMRMAKMNEKQKAKYLENKQKAEAYAKMSPEEKANLSFMEKKRYQMASMKQRFEKGKSDRQEKYAAVGESWKKLRGKNDVSLVNKRTEKLNAYEASLNTMNLTPEQKAAKMAQREKELKKQYGTTSEKRQLAAKTAVAKDLVKRAQTDPEAAKELALRKTQQQQRQALEAAKRSGATPEEIAIMKQEQAKQLANQQALPPGVPSNAPPGSTMGPDGKPVGPDGKPLKVGKDGKVLTGKALKREEMRDKMKAKVGKMEEKFGAMKDAAGKKIMESRSTFYKIFFTIFITFALGIFIFPTIVLAGMGFLTFLITKDHITRLFTM